MRKLGRHVPVACMVGLANADATDARLQTLHETKPWRGRAGGPGWRTTVRGWVPPSRFSVAVVREDERRAGDAVKLHLDAFEPADV